MIYFGVTNKLIRLWEFKKKFLKFQIIEPIRSFLLHRRYDIRLLKLEDIEKIDIEEYQVPTCQFCKENCCRGYVNIVTLRLIDIARLIDLGLQEAITLEKPPRDVFKMTKARRNFFKSELWKRFPILKQKEDGSCYFLDEQNRCVIYDYAPLICKKFPFTLSQDKKEIFYSPKCKTYSISIANKDKFYEHINAVIEHYNEMIKDLVLIYHAKKELKYLGLDKYLIL